MRRSVSVLAFLTGALGVLAILYSYPTLAAPGHSDRGGHHGRQWGQPGKPSEVVRTIRIVATDSLFDKSDLRIRAGETVRFLVTNQGELDHDFTLGDAATQRAHRREMAPMMNMDVAPDMTGHEDSNAVMLNPSQTKELIWRFTHPGTLEFACNIPGHYEAGMKGVIRITAATAAGPANDADASFAAVARDTRSSVSMER